MANNYINGEMLVSEVNAKLKYANYYTTDEIVVGRWFDGKPVYRKTVTFNNTTVKHQTYVNHGITNLKEVVKASGVFYDGVGSSGPFRYVFPFMLFDYENYLIGFTIGPQHINILINNNATQAGFQISGNSNRLYRFTIEYTKTTD